jgi:hypothetical protein
MTEAEWLAATHPAPMVSYLRLVSDRKYRLLACACCGWVLGSLNRSCNQALSVAEAFADGEASLEQLRKASRDAFRSAQAKRRSHVRSADWLAMSAVASACEVNINQALHAVGMVANYRGGHTQPRLAQAFSELVPVVHDIFGNPFRPVAVEPAWLTSTVVALAEGVYQDRAFDRLPILADALMDAGCDNDDVLNHCRGEGPHVRGCWVVDLLTGRK